MMFIKKLPGIFYMFSQLYEYEYVLQVWNTSQEQLLGWGGGGGGMVLNFLDYGTDNGFS